MVNVLKIHSLNTIDMLFQWGNDNIAFGLAAYFHGYLYLEGPKIKTWQLKEAVVLLPHL